MPRYPSVTMIVVFLCLAIFYVSYMDSMFIGLCVGHCERSLYIRDNAFRLREKSFWVPGSVIVGRNLRMD